MLVSTLPNTVSVWDAKGLMIWLDTLTMTICSGSPFSKC